MNVCDQLMKYCNYEVLKCMFLCVCMYVPVCVCERERECVCVRDIVCVCERERV